MRKDGGESVARSAQSRAMKLMKTSTGLAFVAIVLGSLLVATRAVGAAVFPPQELVGTWQGTTEISGPFKVGTYPSPAPEDHQIVIVEIAASGVVTGQSNTASTHITRQLLIAIRCTRRPPRWQYQIPFGSFQNPHIARDAFTDRT